MKTIPSPLIVSGMYRSGLSLVASLLDDQVRWDSGIEEFQERLLRELCSDKNAHWAEHEIFDRSRLAFYFPQAKHLLTSQPQSPPRGWRHAATTLFLDFWDEVLAHKARYVLIYRYPWDVADSLQRHGEDFFLRHPERAYSLWSFYNRRLLNFYQSHRDRCLLVSANALVQNPSALLALLNHKFDLRFSQDTADRIFEPDLWSAVGGSDPLIDLVAAALPETINLLSVLDTQADLPATSLWRSRPPRTRLLRPDQTVTEPVLVSIVIPSYNQGQLLLEAVASVERCAPSQTELIILDDGSQDQYTQDTLYLLRAGGYFVQQQANAGLAGALNSAVSLARGEYILPLAHDNTLCAGFIEAATDILKKDPSGGVVYGNRRDFGLRSAVVDVPTFDLNRLLLGNYIDASAVFRKKVWAECGGYDATMFLEDWEFWINVASHGWRFHKLDQVTFNYRVRPNSLFAQVSSHTQLKQQMLRMTRKHYPLYLMDERWMAYLSEMWPYYLERERIIAERDIATARLTQARQQIAQAQQQIELMQRSKGWRFSVSYWNWRDRLLQLLRVRKP